MNLKSTLSILTLSLCLTIPNVLSMEDLRMSGNVLRTSKGENGVPRYEAETLNPSQHLTVRVVKDPFPDSASAAFWAEGVVKKKVQAELSDLTGHKEPRRILALDGGGIRGLFPIITLAVLEELINHPTNKDLKEKLLAVSDSAAQGTPLYIRDLFDVGAGTSTGSILVAGLFSKRNYSATDVAKLYARYGYKIFDEQKRGVAPGLNIGLISATYSNEGLKTLLNDHFKNDALQNVHKPIYIIGLNESNQSAAIFSSNALHGDADHLHHTPLREAVLCSSAAPTFFPGVNIQANGGSYLMSDGGTVANNPAYTVYQHEKMTWGNPFEIYSFGTGLIPSPEVRPLDSGVRSVAAVLINTLVAGENLAYKKCVDEIESISSQLHYFARLNPKLEKGMDKLDDTRGPYIEYAVQKALSLTRGRAFANMVSQLGFNMPTADELTGIHETVRHKLDSLKSKTYGELDKYEKEFVIKKVLDLDFNFYQKSFYQDAAGGIQQMTHEEAKIFLEDLMQDIVEKRKTKDGFISYLWGMVSTSDADSIREFIPRCQEFHQLSNNKITLTDEDFLLLTTQESQFTQAQLKNLSPKHIIKGEGWISVGSQAAETQANNLVFELFRTFIDCCDNRDAKYRYLDNKASYIHLPALIFWKNALKNMEGKATKDQLSKLKQHLTASASQIMNSRSYTAQGITEAVRGSRYGILAGGLDAYISKFCKD